VPSLSFFLIGSNKVYQAYAEGRSFGAIRYSPRGACLPMDVRWVNPPFQEQGALPIDYCRRHSDFHRRYIETMEDR
jgi:hypothetical protein